MTCGDFGMSGEWMVKTDGFGGNKANSSPLSLVGFVQSENKQTNARHI
jgi:hypothetical protein